MSVQTIEKRVRGTAPPPYATKIIKADALLDDTKSLHRSPSHERQLPLVVRDPRDSV